MDKSFLIKHQNCPFKGLLYTKLLHGIIIFPVTLICPKCKLIYGACNYCASGSRHCEECRSFECSGCLQRLVCTKCKGTLVTKQRE